MGGAKSYPQPWLSVNPPVCAQHRNVLCLVMAFYSKNDRLRPPASWLKYCGATQFPWVVASPFGHIGPENTLQSGWGYDFWHG